MGSFSMDKFLRQHDIFYKKSESDLEAAKILLGSKSGKIDIDVILFHLQQSTEKLLKCLLSYNRVHVEKVHDIEHLVSILRGNGITLPELRRLPRGPPRNSRLKGGILCFTTKRSISSFY